jgi:hypothetical protein
MEIPQGNFLCSYHKQVNDFSPLLQNQKTGGQEQVLPGDLVPVKGEKR